VVQRAQSGWRVWAVVRKAREGAYGCGEGAGAAQAADAQAAAGQCGRRAAGGDNAAVLHGRARAAVGGHCHEVGCPQICTAQAETSRSIAMPFGQAGRRISEGVLGVPFGSFEDGQSPEDVVQELRVEEGRYEVFACDIAIPVLQVYTGASIFVSHSLYAQLCALGHVPLCQ